MKCIFVLMVLSIPAGGICSDTVSPVRPAVVSVTLSADAGVSSTVHQGSCLVPGAHCTLAELERERAFVLNEMKKLQAENDKDVKKNSRPASKAGKIVMQDDPKKNIRMRFMGLRRVECRLKDMEREIKMSSTAFNQSSVGENLNIK